MKQPQSPATFHHSETQPHLLIASPHCFADLARLWHHFVLHNLVPAMSHHGLRVTVLIFCDANSEEFNPADFPGAQLCFPGPQKRDFLEFYDFALGQECDFLLLLDADAFIFHGDWAASCLQRFEDPAVSAVSLVPRKEEPAIYALLCRSAHYRELDAPIFPSHYESVEAWPKATNLQPGDFAAKRLLAADRKIVSILAEESERNAANFHGTTVVRICRNLFGRIIGDEQFEALIQRERYYMVGVYDNVLLGSFYERLFGLPFAPDASGNSLGGSMSLSALRRILKNIHAPQQQHTLREWFERSNMAILRMAAREGIDFTIPPIIPEDWTG
ncbi:MAG TPA: hypothetical protein VFK06_17485 [Candidatus Angelobacter sp.]|nr:hypothetical protein [Candidatus Angelobacter sp.]